MHRVAFVALCALCVVSATPAFLSNSAYGTHLPLNKKFFDVRAANAAKSVFLCAGLSRSVDLLMRAQPLFAAFLRKIYVFVGFL